MSSGPLWVVALLIASIATGMTAAASEGGAAVKVGFALRGNASTSVAVPSGYTVRFIARVAMRRTDAVYIDALRGGESNWRTLARCTRSPCYANWRETSAAKVRFQAVLVHPVDAKTNTNSYSRNITVSWYTGGGGGGTGQQPGYYKGKTADGQEWEFYVAADGRNVVKLFSGEINETCNGGPHNYLSGGNLNLPGPFPIAADGSFSIAFSEASTVDENPANDNVRITGRIASGIASGTYQVDTSFSVKDRDGATANYACSSGPQTWTVTRVG